MIVWLPQIAPATMANSCMGKEIELKFEVPPHSVRSLTRIPAFRRHNGARVQKQDLVSVYFDTATHKLRKKGMSLRVRHIGDKRVQTIKANGHSAAGLFRRDEWEKSIRSDTPDLRAVRHTALGSLLSKKLGHALKPVFETRVHRTVLPLDSGGSRIEVTLDQGQVRLGRKSRPISEVELELKRGKPADLFGVARHLTEQVPARLAVRSKADRGYDLVEDRPVAAVRADRIELAPRTSTADALRAIAFACLRHLAANEPAVSAHDPEGVHQMRVGLRRLRAAISVFSELLDDAQTERIKAGLKWLTGELGPARDLDVYVTGNIKPLERTLPPKRGLKALRRDLEAQRSGAFERARKATESTRYRTLVLDTLSWLESGEWTTTGDELAQARRERSADAFAREEIGRRVKKVMRKAQRLAELDARARHKLRIGIKKLRYATEFFQALFAGRKARKRLHGFERQLKALQDCLGALNDIAVHQRLASDFVGAKGRRRERAFAIGLVSGREQSRIDPLRKAAVKAADKFVQVRPFWG
jgi:inorganic triphosphatase YgiF